MERLQRWLPSWLGGASSAPKANVAVYLSGSAVALARADDTADGLRASLRVDPVQGLKEIPAVLARQCRSLQLASSNRCNLVLAPQLYNLALLERAEVPDEELREAMRWRLNDVLDYPVEQATLDVFPLPESASRDRPMVFVVALRTEALRGLLDACSAADVQVASVDISELALRNLVHAAHPEPDRGVGLLRLTGSSGVITLSRGEELFLSRRVQGVPGAFDAALWEEFRDRLLLQVQRSIDYYESAMGQPPCNGLIVATPHDWQAPVAEYLNEMLPVPNRAVVDELGGLLSLRLHNPDGHDVVWDNVRPKDWSAITAALPALGGLLRVSAVTALEQVA